MHGNMNVKKKKYDIVCVVWLYTVLWRIIRCAIINVRNVKWGVKTVNVGAVNVPHMNNLFYLGASAPIEPWLPHYRGFTITLRHSTVGRTPLDEWSVRGRDLYLTTNNTHKRKTSVRPAGFEFKILASERPPTHALDRAATGIGTFE
jgi:hypothetical protein